MALVKVLFVLCLGVLASQDVVQALCNSCSSTSYAACTGARTFEVCFDGQTRSGQVGTCASDEVCTELEGICKKADTNTPTCTSNCGVCESGFACINQNQYSPCVANQPSSAVVTCPDRTYCNIDSFKANQPMCVSTCSSDPTCGTEIESKIDYKTSCTLSSATGLYPNQSDKTCKTYMFCQVVDGTVYSIMYTCSSGYFNETQKKCVAIKPTGCQ